MKTEEKGIVGEDWVKQDGEISEGRVQEYLDNDGGLCPFCGSDEIQMVGDMDLTGLDATANIVCDACGREWQDVYRLVSIELV